MSEKKEYNVNVTFGIELVYILAPVNTEEQVHRQLTQSAIDSHIAIFMADPDNVDKMITLIFGDQIKLTRYLGEELDNG